MTAIVQQGQSIIDIAVQHCGGAEAGYGVAELNGLSITDHVEVGQVLNLPDLVDKDIVRYYADRSIVAATGAGIYTGSKTFDETFDLTFY